MSYLIFSSLLLPKIKNKYPGEKIKRLGYTYYKLENKSTMEVETDQRTDTTPETESKAVNSNSTLQALFSHYAKTFPTFTKLVAVMDCERRTIEVHFFENTQLLGTEKI